MSDPAPAVSEATVDRALQIVAVFFVGLALLLGFYILSTGDLRENPKRMFYTALPGLLALAVWRLGRPSWKRGLLGVLGMLALVEGTLQIAALFDLIPRVHIYKHVPYGRIYYTREGFANERMNRFGWHAREFDADPARPRVALIGDSFVMAAGVPREQVTGSILEDRLQAAGRPHHVTPIGMSNTGPAQYVEFLDYAIRRFPPEDAVIALFLGNDFRNLAVPDKPRRRARSIYYRLGADGQPELLPESRDARRAFVNRLDYNHHGLLLHAPRIFRSYFLGPAVWKETRELVGSLRGGEETAAERDLAAEMRWMGLDAFVFREPLSDEAEGVIRLALALLDTCRERAAESGVTLRVVTIPALLPSFYDRYRGDTWSFEIGDLDLALPDRRVAAWAAERGVPFLSLGQHMLDSGLAVDDLRALYFAGYGHLSDHGQRFLADAIYERFYALSDRAFIVQGDPATR